MKLTVHTRGNVSPKDKPSVFLLSAPGDDEPRKALLTALLSHDAGGNVAVWQADSLSGDLGDLEQMNLIAIAVTDSLMGPAFPDAKRVTDFAEAHGVPMLPVFFGAGQISAFNSRVGELHGVLWTAKNADELLHEQLNRLVLTEESTERIRGKAFQGQLFLSYRKKDRAAALDVMKAVHSLPLYESLAIWFDDFLVAGRDFNEEIDRALTDSDTFLLAVTPSLLEAGNYVRTVEYPRALDASKAVVPVEAEQTERQPLTEAFANLPQPVSVWDGEALRSAIAQAMARKWGTAGALAAPREAEPREKYLLGLAYLNGVRVEKDAARALRLLCEAAEGGVADAALQLGFMYIHGTGVRRDNAQAVAWKEKAFRLCEAGYASEPGEEWLDKAYEAVLGLDGIAAYHRVTDQPEEARAWCRRLEALLRSAPGSDLHTARAAECLITCARAESGAPEERTMERWQQRMDAATEAIEQLEAIENRDDFADRLLGEGYCTLASLQSRCERWEDALRSFGRGVPIARRLMYGHDTVENRTLLADLFIGMGEMSRRRRKMSDAELAYESAVPLLEKNAAETGLPGAREKLAITWHNLSRVTADGGKAQAAMESAVSVIDRLALDAPDDPNVQKDKQYLHKAQREVKRRPLRRALILAAFAGVLALLCYGIWASRIFG